MSCWHQGASASLELVNNNWSAGEERAGGQQSRKRVVLFVVLWLGREREMNNTTTSCMSARTLMCVCVCVLELVKDMLIAQQQ